MGQEKNATVSRDRETQGKFGVMYENSLVLSGDGEHLIAPEGRDMSRILVENLTSGASFQFGENEYPIQTLFFDEDSGTLLAGDWKGCLVEYHLDLLKGEGRTVKKHGHLGIGSICSSSVDRGLVFFGGHKSKARVYSASAKEVLPGDFDTAIEYAYSLQVCVVDESRVWLAVVGLKADYSGVKSDLYDLGGLLGMMTLPGALGDNLESLSSTDVEQLKIKDLRIEELRKQLSESHAKTQGIPDKRSGHPTGHNDQPLPKAEGQRSRNPDALGKTPRKARPSPVRGNSPKSRPKESPARSCSKRKAGASRRSIGF